MLCRIGWRMMRKRRVRRRKIMTRRSKRRKTRTRRMTMAKPIQLRVRMEAQRGPLLELIGLPVLS